MVNQITPADISDPQELIARANALSDGSRFPAVVSVTALRDAQDNIIG